MGDRIVVYAEWADAVRIDVSRGGGNGHDEGGDGDREDDGEALLMELLDDRGRPRILAAFDPVRPCANANLYGPDPRQVIAAFGAARLRRIVAGVALGCVEPTVVQHRLLALAA